LRRVYWCLNHLNFPSQKAAERLGFQLEGIAKWDRVLDSSKRGVALPQWAIERELHLGRGGMGRHTVILGMGWDDWTDGGVEERIRLLMARKVDRQPCH
jgi:RimJ/RimL family protein N-acetyltransferase